MTDERPYHHGNLRTALLERAQSTISEKGVAALSLRELARDIGVSHAAPRRHFPDKQALLTGLALEGFNRLQREITVALGTADAPLADRAQNAAAAYLRFATEEAALLELMFASKHDPGAEDVLAAGYEAFAPILRLIEDGQAAGELPAGDPTRIATILFATLQGLASMANGSMLDPAALEDITRDAIGGLLRGLRPDVAGTRAG